MVNICIKIIKCEKQATGPLNRKKLVDYMNDQGLNTPDIPDAVPHVLGTVRGKKGIPDPQQIILFTYKKLPIPKILKNAEIIIHDYF